MEPSDQAEELHKLEDRYAQMSEGELLALFEELDGLTEIAQQALRAEISRRSIGVKADEVSTEGSSVFNELVDVWTASSLPEALAIKEILDRAGISSCLVPEAIADGYTRAYSSGYRINIKVMGRDVQRARTAISPYYSELVAACPTSAPKPEEERDHTAACPKCGSPNIIFQSLTQKQIDTGADANFNWCCDDCGHRWQDDGNEAQK